MKKAALLFQTIIFLLVISACGKAPVIYEDDSSESDINSNTGIITADIRQSSSPDIPEDTPCPVSDPEPEKINLPLPYITKQPGSESLNAGGKTWFIAHADNDDGICWYFHAPDGSPAKTVDETLSCLQTYGLELEILPEDTIALRNIPYEMNGWQIQAEFYNSSGSVFTDNAYINVTDIPVEYESVFENCRFIKNNISSSNMDYILEHDTYRLIESRELFMKSGNLGYSLIDLDNNGVNELILGMLDENWIGPRGGDIIVALFSLEDGTPVKLLHSWPRCLNSLCSNGLIYSTGSNGAMSHSTDIYEIKGASAVVKESLWNFTVDDVGNPIYHYSTDGNYEETEENTVSAEEAEAFFKRTSSYIVPLPELTPIK